LDTNVLLWLFIGDKRLSPAVKNKIEYAPANYFISIVTLWEIATKRAIGKLEVSMDIPRALEDAGFRNLQLTVEHVNQYDSLPLLHRDPFDRMLIAQALSENVSLLTGDRYLKEYGIKIVSTKP
jgi:PIN domain nuclease of toxin-antitoxin system